MDDSFNFLKSLADPHTWTDDIEMNYSQPEEKTKPEKISDNGLPPIIPGNEFPKQWELPRRRPLIQNLIKRGELMALFAPSKAGKSWFFQNMATCLSEGLSFLNLECVKSNVLILDLELSKVDAMDRLWSIALKMGLKHPPKNLFLWSLKKHCYDLEVLTEALHSRLESMEPFDAVFLDPIYMFNSAEGFDENSAGCITNLMIELEKITSKMDASLIVSHHYRKGTVGKESHFERASGSGAFARFPDVLTTLSEHQLHNHAIFEMTSRSQKSPSPFVVRTEPPVFTRAENADPNAYRKYGEKRQKIELSMDEFLDLVPQQGILKVDWIKKAQSSGMDLASFDRMFDEANVRGMLKFSASLIFKNAGL